MFPKESLPTTRRDWKKELPCQVVQKAYTNARTHDINTNQGAQLRADTEAQFRKDFANKLTGFKDKQIANFCADAYDRLTAVLQSRDLTLNFKARSWFLTPNEYESYAQMYERAVDKETGEMLLRDDVLNPALDRAAADDYVTFPQAWQGQRSDWSTFGGGGRNQGPGLNPRFNPSPGRIMGRMMVGKQLLTPDTVNQGGGAGLTGGKGYLLDANNGYRSPNKLFNPKTKQVFAALNYGRRAHGSSTLYGQSHFVLNSSLKVNSIYFPGDTFANTAGANEQVTYQTLGAIYLKANATLRNEIASSCFQNSVLEDTSATHVLLEAHIFGKVSFKDISILHLCLASQGDAAEQLTIKSNAETFCQKWGIQLDLR